MLPKDPLILLSFVNARLRDRYASLAVLCEDEQVDEVELRRILSAIGYEYNEKRNQFV